MSAWYATAAAVSTTLTSTALTSRRGNVSCCEHRLSLERYALSPSGARLLTATGNDSFGCNLNSDADLQRTVYESDASDFLEDHFWIDDEQVMLNTGPLGEAHLLILSVDSGEIDEIASGQGDYFWALSSWLGGQVITYARPDSTTIEVQWRDGGSIASMPTGLLVTPTESGERDPHLDERAPAELVR